MSGDVQPRKRKDKKRKKEDSTEQIPTQFQPPPIPNLNDDVNIHVHKDEGTGGGICAKIVFFLLFSALAVVIGLIITEHRGLTDLDTVDTESRFSQIFEGWTDISHDDHDDDDHIVSSLKEDHEHEEESHEVEDHDEHEEEEEEEHEVSEEHSQAEEEEEDEEDEDHQGDDEEDEEEEESQPVESEEIEEEEESAQKDEEDEDNEVSEEPQSEEKQDDEEEQEEESANAENSVEEEDEDETANGDDDNEEQQADEDDQEDNEEGSEEQVQSEEQPQSEEQAVSQEKSEEAAYKKEDEEKDQTSQEEENEEGKDEPAKIGEGEDEQTENDENADTSRMVVKIGVGVALLVVAHVVLVRKWKSETPPGDKKKSEESAPDLSRRNTIVVPPAFQDIEHDIDDNAEEEYSDEDGEIESEEEPEKLVKTKYQELRTTYTRSLTPESEPEYQPKPDYEEYEAEDEEIEEEEEEEEEEEDEEDDDAVEEGEESDIADEEYEKEDEDEDLLKRLEAKYGKLDKSSKQDEIDEKFSSWKRVNVHGEEPEESDSDQPSDAETYEYENITNKDDSKIKEKIDEAQQNIQNNSAYAIKLFDVLLKTNPSSPRSLYGKAQALDRLADQKQSNEILQKAIHTYLQLLGVDDVPDALFQAAAERCINRMRFIGHYSRAISVHLKLISKFPNEPKFRNQLAVSYLTINRVNKARQVLEETLSKHPNDGFALVHYGFILKTTDNNLIGSIPYLRRGIASGAPGVIDGRFYFHLGDALARLGRTAEAMNVYEEGVAHNLFPSKYQRSLYNVKNLKALPWWDKRELPYRNLFTALEANWQQIRDEGLAVLNRHGNFESETENLRDTGDWKQFELFARGQKHFENCKKCPITCQIIESVPDASGCKRGQTKFSVMHPGTHVWPHCGPTNCRLRVHLGLKVPPNTYIRVADDTRSWENGKVMIFDDSFEHEVWHNGSTFRLVLIVDVWHPELTPTQKRSLSPI